MVIILTIKEMSYLVVGIFDVLVGPAFIFIFVTLRFLPALLALFGHSMNEGPAFTLSHITYCN